MDLLILLGFLAIAYYIYQDPKTFDLNANGPKIVMVVSLFFIYYRTIIDTELFEGFEKGDCKIDSTVCESTLLLLI